MVHRERIFLEAYEVGEIHAARFGAGGGDVGNCGAVRVRKQAVDLARGAKITVGDLIGDARLRGAHDKAGVADGVGGQGGAGWQRDGGVNGAVRQVIAITPATH